jgi:hypothetical protein
MASSRRLWINLERKEQYNTYDSCSANLVEIISFFLRKKGWQPQFEYFKILTIISKYAKSTSKFQNYLLFWMGFNFLKFRQIALIYFTSFLAGMS